MIRPGLAALASAILALLPAMCMSSPVKASASGAAAPADTAPFRWERQVLPPADTAPLGRFGIDASILGHTRRDFADLRLFDRRGRPVGLHVRPVGRSVRHCEEREVPMRRLDLRVMGDSALEAYFLSGDSTPPPRSVAVSLEARDFEMALSLWTAPAAGPGGKPRGGWTLRLDRLPIYDYSRFVDLRSEVARWEGEGHRAVRLRLEGLTQSQRALLSTLSGPLGRPREERYQVERRPVRLEAIAFRGEVCGDRSGGVMLDTVTLASGTGAEPVIEPEAKRSWILLPAGHQALRALLLEPSTRNFMRSAVVTGLADTSSGPRVPEENPWKWPRLAVARIHRIDWGASVDSSLRIPLPGDGRYARLALGLLDEDDAPIVLTGVRAEAVRLEAVFPASGTDTLVLRYGHADAAPSRFDVEAMLRHIPDTRVATYAMDPPRALAPSDGSRSFEVSGNLLLTSGLALAIATLLGLLILVARKIPDAKP